MGGRASRWMGTHHQDRLSQESSTGNHAHTLPAAPGRGVQSCESHLHRGRQRDAVCPAAAEEVSWAGSLGWPRAGLWGICWQRGAQRGWEALGSCSQAKGGTLGACTELRPTPYTALGCTFAWVWYPHIPTPTPCKASWPGHGLDPFSLVPLLQPQHPALHAGVPWTQPP